MKTMILAAIAAVTIGIGASTMAQAAHVPPPWQGHTQNESGQG